MSDFNKENFKELKKRASKLLEDTVVSNLAQVPIYLFLSHKFLLDQEDIRNSYTEGGNDCGIDAVFIDRRPEQPVVNLFQSKFHDSDRKASNAFKYASLDKINRFIAILIDRSSDLSKLVNAPLKQKILEIWELQNLDFPIIKVWLVSNGMPCIAEDIQPVKNTLKEYDIMVEEFHLSELFDFCIKKHSNKLQHKFCARESGVIELGDTELSSVVGYISAYELYNLLKDLRDERKLDYTLFDMNVRGYLGVGTSINQEIVKSASSKDSRFFSSFNNGITLTGSHVKVLKTVEPKRILVKHLNIVNGAQTCSAIFDSMKDHYPNLEQFSDLSVLFRLFQTNDSEMIERIAISTNTQNRIHPRDLKANDEIQQRLEADLKKHHIIYYRKRGMQNYRKRGMQNENNEATLDGLKAGQLILAYEKLKPAEAKKQSDNIFTEWYYELFGRVDVTRLLRAFDLFTKIEKKQKFITEEIRMYGESRTQNTFITYGGFHILSACSILGDLTPDAADDDLIEKAISIIADVLIDAGEPAHYTFFRTTEFSRMILDKCKQPSLFDGTQLLDVNRR